MKRIPCDYGTDSEEFERYVGRSPKDTNELEEWARLLKNGIDTQIDWDIIFAVASQKFKEQDEVKE